MPPDAPFIRDKAHLRTIAAREALKEGYAVCARWMRKYLQTEFGDRAFPSAVRTTRELTASEVTLVGVSDRGLETLPCRNTSFRRARRGGNVPILRLSL